MGFEDRKPAAAPAATDAESGGVTSDDRRRALFALDAMLKRGLIDAADYAARKAAIEAAE